MENQITTDNNSTPNTSSHGSPSLKLEATSQFDIEEFVFEWKLNIFSYGNLAKTENIESPVFTGGPRSQHSWKLKWKPERERWDSYNIEVILVSVGEARFTARGKIKATAFIKFKEPEPGSQFPFEQEQNNLQFFAVEAGGKLPVQNSQINCDQLYDTEQNFITNNTLTVHCRILVSCGIKQSDILHSNSLQSDTRSNVKIIDDIHKSDEKSSMSLKRSLTLDKLMQTALNSEDFADVQLVTQNKTFPAHKVILAARSPVFAAMFRANMLEAKENSVEISDFDEIAVGSMLEYIYTGQSPKLSEHCTDLIRIADKYELMELKAECENFMRSSLKVENAAEILTLANIHSAHTLKADVIKFIHGNKETICKTEMFKKLVETEPSLMLELYLSI